MAGIFHRGRRGAKHVHEDENEDEELQPEVLTYREFHRQRTLGDWYERRRRYEIGISPRTKAGNLASLRNVVAEWVVELASRTSGRSLFRRPV
jgi:hypothetical protein